MTQLSITGTLTIQNPPGVQCPICPIVTPNLEFKINENMELIMIAEQQTIDQYNFSLNQGDLILSI